MSTQQVKTLKQRLADIKKSCVGVNSGFSATKLREDFYETNVILTTICDGYEEAVKNVLELRVENARYFKEYEALVEKNEKLTTDLLESEQKLRKTTMALEKCDPIIEHYELAIKRLENEVENNRKADELRQQYPQFFTTGT